MLRRDASRTTSTHALFALPVRPLAAGVGLLHRGLEFGDEQQHEDRPHLGDQSGRSPDASKGLIHAGSSSVGEPLRNPISPARLQPTRLDASSRQTSPLLASR